jgi:hypothetical protein
MVADGSPRGRDPKAIFDSTGQWLGDPASALHLAFVAEASAAVQAMDGTGRARAVHRWPQDVPADAMGPPARSRSSSTTPCA